MRIGGASRDGAMTLIPLVVAVLVVMLFLGGPDETLRAVERLGTDAWTMVGTWFRH